MALLSMDLASLQTDIVAGSVGLAMLTADLVMPSADLAGVTTGFAILPMDFATVTAGFAAPKTDIVSHSAGLDLEYPEDVISSAERYNPRTGYKSTVIPYFLTSSFLAARALGSCVTRNLRSRETKTQYT